MLTLISESAAQEVLPLVTIDPGTIVFTLVNTLIIFILFRIFLFKPVGKVLDKRNEMAAAEIAEAKRAKESAAKTEQEYLEKLAKAKEEAAEIMKQATARAQRREEEIINDANQKAAEIRARAEENIERDRQSYVSLTHDLLYPCGEGAGYAGGIMSAALDGYHVARAIMERFAPVK